MNRLEKAINPILIVTIGLASCRPVQPKIPSSLEPPASPPGLVTPSIETLIPPISVVLQTPEASEISEKPSPFKNINYGQYRQLDGSLTIIGGIPGSNIRKNNPNVNVIPINGADEVQINTLYNKDYPKSIVGFMIDINSQMQIFNASDTKGGIIGHLPDGTEVRLENNLWTYEKNGLRYFFNPVVANQEGKPFGYPGLVKDKSDAFVFGIFNADGSLVGETTLESPFKTVDQIARSAGFNSDLSQVVSAGLNQQGNLEVYDGQGKILQTFKYLALTLPEPPTAIATAKPTEAPRMTLEDWKEVFTGPIMGDDGKIYDLKDMFSNEHNTFLTDPNQVKMLPLGSPITILNPDGSIIIYSDPDVAAERVEKGAIVLINDEGPTPGGSAIYALTAAARQYQKGNKNIYVYFNENSVGKFPFDNRYGVSINLNQRVLQITLDDGTIITPIMAMPKHFGVSHAYVVEKALTLEQAGIIITNPNNWLDQVLKAGYDAIVIYPW